jgi:glycosyltransferase-like protein
VTVSSKSAGRPRVALVTYSTKPRGGVVHTLNLAEELARAGVAVQVVTLGDPAAGFFREVHAPYRVIAAPPVAETLEQRVFNSIDALEDGLADIAPDVDILHTQDCISARAAARVRDAGAAVRVLRTVHHVDDFTTAALIECQRKAIEEPDRIIVVSEDWRARLRSDYGVDPVVIHNGVDPARFGPIDAARRDARRRDAGVAADRFVFLSVGGIEPRKGSKTLFRALAQLRAEHPPGAALVVVGGHSFQDYAQYREEALSSLPALGLRLGQDVVLAGTVTDEVLHEWYRSADALAFPSVKEGWGLAVLEALAADLPVVASDIAVLREYLTPDWTAVLTRAGDPESLAAGMRRIVEDATLRADLIRGGRELLPTFSWQRTAREHLRIYTDCVS